VLDIFEMIVGLLDDTLTLVNTSKLLLIFRYTPHVLLSTSECMRKCLTSMNECKAHARDLEVVDSGFSQGATATALLLAHLSRTRPELLPKFAILVRGFPFTTLFKVSDVVSEEYALSSISPPHGLSGSHTINTCRDA
jgi:hypothetical protein